MRNMQAPVKRARRRVGLIVVLVAVAVVPFFASAQSGPIMVGILPLASKVADIPAEEAQEMFINALMETNAFAIRPPDVGGSYASSTYVLEPTISEAKAKSNVLGFLKDVATSKAPVSMTVRVFDPRTNTLLKSVTVKSTEISSAQVSVGDVQSLMSTLGVGKSDQAGKAAATDDSARLEERIGALMQQTAARLASQLGAAPVAAGTSRPGSPRR